MEIWLTIAGYAVILVVVFVVAMLKPHSTAGRGFIASLVTIIALIVVNALTFAISLAFVNITPSITAEQVAKGLYGLEEQKQYPLVLATPDADASSEGVIFTLDPQHPVAKNGNLLVRLSVNGKFYELELPQELKQQPSGQTFVELEFDTPWIPKGSFYGEQTLVSESPCARRLTGVLWCERERVYKPNLSEELRSLSISDFLDQALVSATFTVPPDVYRTIKLG